MGDILNAFDVIFILILLWVIVPYARVSFNIMGLARALLCCLGLLFLIEATFPKKLENVYITHWDSNLKDEYYMWYIVPLTGGGTDVCEKINDETYMKLRGIKEITIYKSEFTRECVCLQKGNVSFELSKYRKILTCFIGVLIIFIAVFVLF